MTETQAHIRVLFQQAQPELLLRTIQDRPSERHLPLLSAQGLSQEGYLHCARAAMLERSEDELSQFYYDLADYLRTRPTGGIFSLLGIYSEGILRFSAGVPRCRMEKLLDWRELSLELGQDLFTCAGLAWEDCREGCRTTNFCWPTAIRIDCAELYDMLSRQLSENHYHLNGSTQCFPLSWAFLMNHPSKIAQYFSDSKFNENLRQGAHFGPGDNVMPWKDRVLCAAWLRTCLFQCIRDPNYIAKCRLDRFLDSLAPLRNTQQQVESLRFLYGAQFEQPDGLTKCLDYAIPTDVELECRYATRLLSGERRLLYDCFKVCYSTKGLTSEGQHVFQNLFYLYLLIKIQFRRELIQSNQRYGFRNFSEYQDRKAHVWGDFPEYWSESYRLSISAVLDVPVHSLEMRVMTGFNADQLKQNILLPDRYSYFHLLQLKGGAERLEPGSTSRFHTYAQEQDSHFFVLHFAKSPLERISEEDFSDFLPKARYHPLRTSVEKQAKTIARSMERAGYLCSRVRGIDAASHEVGCRPEVFATAFRFLRNFSPTGPALFPRFWPLLGVTYHAGEDFLDIADGLRAIDEAICFLDLRCGDRIGHGLALGISPRDYFRLKQMRMILPAQDLLDNLVWLLFRSLEWDISMSHMLRVQLEQRAEELFRRLYWKNTPDATLRDYFHSWLLRGDDPSPLSWPSEEPPKRADARSQFLRYPKFRERVRRPDEPDLTLLRRDRHVRQLLYRYQFGREERLASQAPESFLITPAYVELIVQFQEQMMRRLMDLGICIECNPSSNVLIGTFRKYEKHPIFRFNSFGLQVPEHKDGNIQLRVSINTDDQGIFDTSLENEYALLYCGMCARRDEAGNPVFSQDAVYGYLDHVRAMGNGMVFPKAQLQYLSRLYD